MAITRNASTAIGNRKPGVPRSSSSAVIGEVHRLVVVGDEVVGQSVLVGGNEEFVVVVVGSSVVDVVGNPGDVEFDVPVGTLVVGQ